VPPLPALSFKPLSTYHHQIQQQQLRIIIQKHQEKKKRRFSLSLGQVLDEYFTYELLDVHDDASE